VVCDVVVCVCVCVQMLETHQKGIHDALVGMEGEAERLYREEAPLLDDDSRWAALQCWWGGGLCMPCLVLGAGLCGQRLACCLPLCSERRVPASLPACLSACPPALLLPGRLLVLFWRHELL
jgi:hypothetical protein